jgi:hypothetical protein
MKRRNWGNIKARLHRVMRARLGDAADRETRKDRRNVLRLTAAGRELARKLASPEPDQQSRAYELVEQAMTEAGSSRPAAGVSAELDDRDRNDRIDRDGRDDDG